MEPTLDVGQRVLVNRIGNRFSDPERRRHRRLPPAEGRGRTNQCGVPRTRGRSRARSPTADAGSDVNFIKRVVAGPGDTHRDPRRPRDPQRRSARRTPSSARAAAATACNFPKPITIPPGHWFMMGDNRGASDDSRFWGPVPKKWIIGGAFATYWPPERIGLL